jgi:hypothetical protein
MAIDSDDDDNDDDDDDDDDVCTSLWQRRVRGNDSSDRRHNTNTHLQQLLAVLAVGPRLQQLVEVFDSHLLARLVQIRRLTLIRPPTHQSINQSINHAISGRSQTNVGRRNHSVGGTRRRRRRAAKTQGGS